MKLCCISLQTSSIRSLLISLKTANGLGVTLVPQQINCNQLLSYHIQY